MATTSTPVPAVDDDAAPLPARPARRVVPRLAAASVAAALLGGGIAAASPEPSPPTPLAYYQGWPAKWCGC